MLPSQEKILNTAENMFATSACHEKNAYRNYARSAELQASTRTTPLSGLYYNAINAYLGRHDGLKVPGYQL